jgi:hypothetical protein
MSQPRPEPPAEEPAAPPAALEPSPAAQPPPEPPPPETPPPARSPGAARPIAALGLFALLVLVIAAVALSPFWAPAVAPMLPWGAAPAAADYDALAARVAALEQRPVAPPVDADALKSAQAALAQRVGALDAAVNDLRQSAEAGPAAKAALAQLTQRLDAVEAQSAARNAGDTAQIQKIQQELAQRVAAGGDLANRLAALERQVQAQSDADRSGSVLLLALLQMREAVEQARPFAGEYAAFKTLVARDPDLAAAAELLADPARDGVAGRDVLRQRLDALAGEVVVPKASAEKRNWWQAALDRLRGLVTIRRIEGAATTGLEAAVDAARSALAQDDLAAAVTAMDKLTGADAEAAQPWLQMARRRLAAQAALKHLQDLLTARLGAAPAAPAPAAAPTPSTLPPPAAPKSPS